MSINTRQIKLLSALLTAILILCFFTAFKVEHIDSVVGILTEEKTQSNLAHHVKRDIDSFHDISEAVEYSGYTTTPFVLPNNKTYDANGMSKRSDWQWFGIYLSKTGLEGFAIAQLVTTCRDWSENGAWGQTGCVVGAVASCIAILTSYQELATHMVELGLQMGERSELFDKREIGFHSKVLSVAGNVADSVGAPVAFLMHNNGSYALNTVTGYPILVLQYDNKSYYHISLMSNKDGSATYRLEPVSISEQTITKRNENFNLQNFAQGGLEAAGYHIDDVADLSTVNDYGTIDHQVSCQYDGSVHAYDFEGWDYNHNRPLTTGWLYAYQYQPYDDAKARMFHEPGNAAPDMGSCLVK